ncbi:MAG TPA: hypothetical protein VI916_00140 [Acidimicrobiia bacterium]|nr:hypothetical protein [Acidimicrobiia bacterium]
MFDTDALVADCLAAVADGDPKLAVRDVLQRFAIDNPGGNPAVAPAPGLSVLYNAPELTILDVVWPPLMSLYPHDHRMWAAIAIYGGQEDNEFFRREEGRIVTSGGKELREGDVLLLGDDAIHAVHNPVRRYTGAIHVYGGDFIAQPRSQWSTETLAEEPYDLEAVMQEFARADEAFRSS